MAFELGQRVGDYEVVQLLGTGGMGNVYRVRNVISDRTEAMKVLLPDLTAERDLAIRFISEIRTLASFDHPNIALLHTAFQADNQLIMMMEFVEGATLEQRAKQGPMTVAEVAGCTSQVLSALSYAHSRKVVHRDIKPANIMLTAHGVVKLMDFGIAKSGVETNLTRPGTTIGSLYYMSPEQVRGDTVDGRSDLYSVGIMLYELLAGRRPFEADSTFNILNQQLHTPPQPPIEVNPSLPRTLNDIILHALAKSPDERYQSADEFKEALRPFCSRPPGEAGHAAVTAARSAGSAAAPPPAATLPQSQPQSPPFANVAVPQAAPRSAYSAAPASSSSQKSHKTLWIGTGVAAAILAMAGLAIGLPRLLNTHAAESNRGDGSSQTAQPQSAQSQTAQSQTAQSQTAQLQPAQSQTTQPEPTTLPSGAAASAGTSPATAQPGSSQAFARGGSSSRQPYLKTGSPGGVQQETQPTAQGNAATSPPFQPQASAAQIEQDTERYTQLVARAGAVDSSLAHLRTQQEAEGLGLRGDIESADNRLQSYLRAADQDLRGSNTASAGRNLNRAEAELGTLEKFLGR